MDPGDFGLPMSFGKQQPSSASSSSLPSKPSAPAQTPNRGEHSGRGPRGSVGAGKRGRGRGTNNNNNGRAQDAGYRQRTNGNEGGNGPSNFVGGVKRPHPPSPNDPSFSSNRDIPPNYRQNQPFCNRGGRGGRGRGGGPRQGSGNEHGGGGERGFWKDSFLEDPWKQLEEQRARTKT